MRHYYKFAPCHKLGYVEIVVLWNADIEKRHPKVVIMDFASLAFVMKKLSSTSGCLMTVSTHVDSVQKQLVRICGILEATTSTILNLEKLLQSNTNNYYFLELTYDVKLPFGIYDKQKKHHGDTKLISPITWQHKVN